MWVSLLNKIYIGTFAFWHPIENIVQKAKTYIPSYVKDIIHIDKSGNTTTLYSSYVIYESVDNEWYVNVEPSLFIINIWNQNTCQSESYALSSYQLTQVFGFISIKYLLCVYPYYIAEYVANYIQNVAKSSILTVTPYHSVCKSLNRFDSSIRIINNLTARQLCQLASYVTFIKEPIEECSATIIYSNLSETIVKNDDLLFPID